MAKLIFIFILACCAYLPSPAIAENHADCKEQCSKHDSSMGCENAGRCKTDGRCGKRRGDWYGASHPVADARDAGEQLRSYFAGQELTVSAVSEKKWGYVAEILDRDGKIVDKVMIDKRSGRIRSIF